MSITKVPLDTIKYPYDVEYDRGYISYIDDGLDNVMVCLCLKGKNAFKSKTTYSRYLMETHLGRFLEKHEKVFHKDGDKLNHHIDNLEIKLIGLSKTDEPKSTVPKRSGAVIVELVCDYCKTKFNKPKSLLTATAKNRFCSHRCQHLFARSAPKTSPFNRQQGF